MKKIFVAIVATVAVFLFGNTNVFAGYWSDYFNEKNPISTMSSCGYGGGGPTTWESHSNAYTIMVGGCGDFTDPFTFNKTWYTDNELYFGVTGVTVKSSNDSIVTAEVKDYDFSKEENAFNEYVKWYNGLSLDEFNKIYLDYYNNNDGDEKVEPFETKPTWWEYNNQLDDYNEDYKTEPKTWWEAYHLDQKPTNAVEIYTYAHDLGKAKITLNATDKDPINIDWTISVRDFDPWPLTGDFKNKAQGFVELLNNFDKYKDIIPEKGTNDWDNYNFSYYVEENEDLSGVINALKGKDITLYFRGYGAIGEESYYLNGLDIKNTVDKGFTYEHKISMETSINKEKIEELVDLKDAIYIDFTYHGSLPTNYKLNVNIEDYLYSQFMNKYSCDKYDYNSAEYNACTDKAIKELQDYLKNTEFTLLYFNPETNQMEVVKDKLKPDEHGNITLEFEHFSSYVLAAGYEMKTPVNTTQTNNAQTSSINVIFYTILALGSLSGGIYLGFKKKINL